jgi:hypothetical protein
MVFPAANWTFVTLAITPTVGSLKIYMKRVYTHFDVYALCLPPEHALFTSFFYWRPDTKIGFSTLLNHSLIAANPRLLAHQPPKLNRDNARPTHAESKVYVR